MTKLLTWQGKKNTKCYQQMRLYFFFIPNAFQLRTLAFWWFKRHWWDKMAYTLLNLVSMIIITKKIYSIPYKQFGLVLQYYYNTCILIEYLLFMPLTTRYIMNQIHDNISSVWNNKSFLFSFKVFMQVIRFMFIPYFCFYFWCSVTFMI